MATRKNAEAEQPVEAAAPVARVAVDLLSHKPFLFPRGAIVTGLLPDDVLAGCVARGEIVLEGAQAAEPETAQPEAELDTEPAEE